MFGGGGMNPRKLQQMMQQMGIDLDELDAESVVIRMADGEELVFDDPDVTRMDARGQQTYQVIGEPEARDATADTGQPEVEGDTEADAGGSDIPDSDVELVAQRTGASEDAAREALEETDGDLAAAVSRLE